jgi:Probable Zinc-ribbon domain
MPRLKVTPETSLAGLFPEVATQWHPTQNGDLKPDQVAPGTHAKAWWKCDKGADHEWQANISDRANKATKCPFCTNYRASATNSLATLRPDIAAEWHPTRNGGLTPAAVVEGSTRRVWWKCPKGTDHEWKAAIVARTHGTESGCLCCAGLKASTTNCIATVSPKAVALWHASKNLPDTPASVVAGTQRKFWWRCNRGHEWQATAKSVAVTGTGCRYCLGQVLDPDGSNSLAAKYPKLAAEWHPTKNKLTAKEVLGGGKTDYWWRCSKDPSHEWEACIANRVSRESGCPKCSGRDVTPTTSFQARFPDIAEQWHPTKNGTLTPAQVMPGSNRKVWWKCTKGPDHEWLAPPNNRTNQRQGCPFCAGLKVSVTNSLASQYPKIAAEMHPTKNGKLDPANIYSGSEKKCWWVCEKGHEWEALVRNRTNGSGCH